MFRNCCSLSSRTSEDNSVFYESPVRDLSPDEIEFYEVDSKPRTLDPAVLKKRSGLIFANRSKTKVFKPNPYIAHPEDAANCDLKRIFSQNPDINGLSLIADDSYKNDLRQRVSIEDFIPPSQYVDIIDVQNFMQQAKNSFMQLPASFRKLYNNNAAELCASLENPSKKIDTLHALEQFLDPLLPTNSSQSAETASRQGASSTGSPETPLPKGSSEPSSEVNKT